jgi:cytochrome c553
MKTLIAFLCILSATIAHASPFPGGQATEGEKIFKHYQCNRCHADMMGGEGNEIFTRPNHKVKNASDLIRQIKACSGNVAANLSAREEQHLAAYLNRYYNLK